MTIRSGFFNSKDGDRKVDAEWLAEYFATFVGTGVFVNPSDSLQVLQLDNMTTVLRPGKGWINGYFVINDSDSVLQHDLADGVLKRIDRVVMRLDHTARRIDIKIKKGVFASTPVAPELQRDGTMVELALADVFISNGATQITQGNITDYRLNTELCGVVHGTVDQVDTTTIFNQYLSWYNQMTGEKIEEFDGWFEQHQLEFNAWLDGIKDLLNTDVAGNLLLLIEENEANIKSAIKIKTDVSITPQWWVQNGERYEVKFYDTDILAISMVDINIHLESLPNAGLILSVNESFDGGFTLYADGEVEHTITFDYRITNEVIQ